MLPIDPSHFVAVSFILFMALLVWRRFFNANQILDAHIHTIDTTLKNAEQQRAAAYEMLKQTNAELHDIENEVATIIEKATHTCDTLIKNFQEKLALEITQKEKSNAKHIEFLEEQLNTMCQERLINLIMTKTKEAIHAHSNDTFNMRQLDRSIDLIASLKCSA